MGTMFGVKCSKCDYRFEANIGHGFLWCGFFELDVDTEKPYYYGYIKSKKILTRIENILETWDDVHEDKSLYSKRDQWHGHGSAQYLCPKCGKLHNKFYFAITGSGGTYEPEYHCSKCRVKLVLVELIQDKQERIRIKAEQEIKWQCPNCENNKLVIDNESRFICYD